MINEQKKANMIIAHCDKNSERHKETIGLEVEDAAFGRAVREGLSKEVMET